MSREATQTGIPRVRVVVPRKSAAKQATAEFNPDRELVFRYDMREHERLPHVVKFSGGRSSGMLLLLLLENEILKPERGDVVVFNNTSAEHPATYEFVREFKAISEGEYGVPFLWTEFQTYEDVFRGRWARMPSYRMVRPEPFSAERPDGHHCRGEVFEELMSWKAYVPNLFRRVCTETMKLFVTREFLRDWLTAGTGIERLGHYGREARVRDEDMQEMHRASGGAVPEDVLLEKREFIRGRPIFRPAQQFADFSTAAGKICNPLLDGRARGGRVEVNGDNRVEYVAFVGFRHDEPVRVARMRERNYGTADEESVHEKNRPEGEYAYAPLDDFKIRKEHIAEFWRDRKPRLLLPDNANLSNCVFCFLKGASNIRDLVARQEKIDKSLPARLRSVAGTPSDVGWWVDMEEKYGRDLKREKRKITRVNGEVPEKPIIGFFGMGGGGTYAFLRTKGLEARAHPRRPLKPISLGEESVSCECTD